MRWPVLTFVAAVAAAGATEDAADAVRSAHAAGRDLAELAARDEPDPWLVVEELCERGDHDAAVAFARAAPRPDTDALPAYAAWRRKNPHDRSQRAAVAKGRESGDPEQWLAILRDVATDRPDVLAFRVRFGRAVAFSRLRRYAEAAASCRRAAETARALGWLRAEALSLSRVALCHQRVLDYAAAAATLVNVLELYKKRRDAAGTCSALEELALSVQRHGDVARAGRILREVVAMRRDLGDPAGLARSLHRYGVHLEEQGKYAASLRAYQESLDLLEETGGEVAGLLHNMGIVSMRLNEMERARRFEQRALAAARASGNRRLEAKSLLQLGTLMRGRNPAVAIRHATSALELFRTLGDRRGVVSALESRAMTYLAADLEDALTACKEALAAAEALGDPRSLAAVLGNVGIALATRGDHDGAVAALRRSLEVADEHEMRQIVFLRACALANVELTRGRPRAVVAWAKKAVARLAELYHGLAEGQGAAARDRWKQIFEIGLVASIQLEDAAAGNYFLETGRAGTLLEALGSREVVRRALIPARLRTAEEEAQRGEAGALRRYRAALASGRRDAVRERRAELRTARERLAATVARIQREARAAASAVYPAPASLEEIRAALRPDEAFVTYACRDRISAALVVHAEGTALRELTSPAEIVAACRALRLERPGADPSAAVEELRRLVIEPLPLAGAKRLLVSPDADLSYLPFALLDDRDVALVPSATTYFVMADERSQTGEGVLALAGRVPPQGAAPLPAAAAEANAIGDVVLLGAQATRARLAGALSDEDRRWRAVHFACHAQVDPARPLFSALRLTPSANDSGLLRPPDVIGLRIPADLVVLSACETARGKVYRSEGVVGFTRAFMLAGAPRVIVSLWKVDDEATRALMVKFYELWKRGKTPTATALRKAQDFVRSREKWRDPYYWAAWQLWGLPE